MENKLIITKPVYSLRQLGIYFLRLGSIGFGGPVALVGYMNRDLVEEKNGSAKMTIKKVLHWHSSCLGR